MSYEEEDTYRVEEMFFEDLALLLLRLYALDELGKLVSSSYGRHGRLRGLEFVRADGQQTLGSLIECVPI